MSAASSALDRTLAELGSHVRLLLLGESYPARDGFLQRVHPNLKLAGLTALVVVAVAADDVRPLLGLLAVAFALARLSAIPLRTLASRLWFAPSAALLVAAPRLFLAPGTPLATVGPVALRGPVGALVPLATLGPLSVTTPGVVYVATFVVRVAACVALLSLLVLTTRFVDLLGALRRFRVPAVLVGLVAVTHRYLLVFFAELRRLVLARRARTVPASRQSVRTTWRQSGSLLGSFFVRALERSERVQMAATARGGGRRAVDVAGRRRSRSLSVVDCCFVAVTVAVAGAVMLA